VEQIGQKLLMFIHQLVQLL